ncbi:MAG: hypothetical protein Lokiarch_03030 [Candidatus Lokiarchaeum sp. GC14_75]|nr:MAG: hypothetical protein Lokiarch_03030 [Candidatus Lokiarchaeum sp. GC14_75]
MNDEKEKKTVELPAFDFFKINFLSFLVPLYICLGLFILFEYLFVNLLVIPLLIHFLIIPGILLFFYYLYLVLLIEFVALWSRIWNKKSPPQEGVFARNLDDNVSPEGRIMKYYHKRGFIIKFPLWLTSKSPFPWLMNRTLRRIGHNKIGKNVIYCNAYAGLEFTKLDDNVFIYPTSGLSSHAVNSIFGKISILEIRMGKNTTLYPGCIVGPNAVTEESYTIYPNTILHKNWRGKPGKSYYQGSPGRPL